jgi:hypothetical protein
MPYEPHANLIQPVDDNAYIWQFSSSTWQKFLDLFVAGACISPVATCSKIGTMGCCPSSTWRSCGTAAPAP